MNDSDKKLGMNRPITRRDIIHGMGALGVGALSAQAMLSVSAFAETDNTSPMADNYPPALTGLRGSHQGSFEVAHQLAREGVRDWGSAQEPDAEIYDLVVVGAGISGLSAAHFYRKQHPQARILIVDNHDDFGGHAKRNEFQVGNRTLIGYGGSQTLQEPSGYSDTVKGLLRDLGVDIKRFDSAYDREFYKRHGLGAGIHFNREQWGADRVVPFDLGMFDGYLPVAPSPLSAQQAVAKMPISERARDEFLRLLLMDEDQMADIPAADKWRYLYTISYREFLAKHLDIKELEVFAMLQDLASDWGVGIEAVPAYSAMS